MYNVSEEIPAVINNPNDTLHRQELERKRFVYCFNLGVDYRQQGDKQEAIKAWTEAIRINPYNPYSYYYRGVTLIDVEDYTGAILDLNQAIAINSNYFNAYRQAAKAYYKLGQTLQLNKNDDGAREIFQYTAQLLCNINQAKELAKWSPFELGESNRKEAIHYLILYLATGNGNEKRLAASAIRKLTRDFKESCVLAVPYLLANLSHSMPQVRQYTLKALSLLDLSTFDISNIELVAATDSKKYNREAAKIIIEGYKLTQFNELNFYCNTPKQEFEESNFPDSSNYDEYCEFIIDSSDSYDYRRTLLEQLSFPKLRQYVLKRLSIVNLPQQVLDKIREIANTDPDESNRKAAIDLLKVGNNVYSKKIAYYDNSNEEEFDFSSDVESISKICSYDTSMDYGYLNDLSDSYDYFHSIGSF